MLELDISGREDYMYNKEAYELGAVFNAIMMQLICLDPIYDKYNYHPKHVPKYTSYKEYRSYGIFTRAAPAPGPLKWDSEDSYELRLLYVLYKDYAVRRKNNEFNTLQAVHTAINDGIQQIIYTHTNGEAAVTVVQNPYAQVTATPRNTTSVVGAPLSTVQEWPYSSQQSNTQYSLPGAVDDERKPLLGGGGRITRRRRRKGKRGSRRN